MIKILPVDNSDHAHTQLVRAIRLEVFVVEQRCDPSQEMEEIDKTCNHWLAMDDQGQAVGTTRCIPYKQDTCKIGRVAVLKSHRGKGIGGALMQAALQHAQHAGYRAVVLHAQCDKTAFYERLGFVTTDPTVFYEENIPHVKMEHRLSQ